VSDDDLLIRRGDVKRILAEELDALRETVRREGAAAIAQVEANVTALVLVESAKARAEGWRAACEAAAGEAVKRADEYRASAASKAFSENVEKRLLAGGVLDEFADRLRALASEGQGE
jgi:hypothetical protein